MLSVYTAGEGFIVNDILEALKSHGDKYSCETFKGLTALKTLGAKLSAERVKCYRGMFHQAKLVGFCLSSGWIHTNRADTKQKNQLPELMLLLSAMETADFKREALSDKSPEQAIEFCLIRGFEQGVRLGMLARQNLQKQGITTQTLLGFLNRSAQSEPVIPAPQKIVAQKQIRQSRRGHQSRRGRDYTE